MYLLRNDSNDTFLCMKTKKDKITGETCYNYYWGPIHDPNLRITDDPKIFETIIEKYPGFSENLEMIDGGVYPPYLVKQAAEINNFNYKASVSIVEMSFNTVKTIQLVGKISYLSN